MDVSFSPDGQHIAVCSSVNGKVSFQSYKTEDGSTVYTVPSATSGLYALDYSPDGQRIAVSGFDGMIDFIRLQMVKPCWNSHPLHWNRCPIPNRRLPTPEWPSSCETAPHIE